MCLGIVDILYARKKIISATLSPSVKLFLQVNDLQTKITINKTLISDQVVGKRGSG